MSVHPTAVIDPAGRLGAGVSVGPFAVIEAATEIGDGCEVRAHSVVKRFTTLGPNNVVHEGAILGGEPQDLGFRECDSYLRVGASNTFREGVTVNRGTQPGSETVIGSNCFIMVCAHIAHNCRLGEGVIIANNVALAGHVDIEDRAFISAGVAVHQFCRVGRLAMIGGNSKIVQDCLPFVVTDGVPGRAHGLNVVGLRRAGFKSSEIQKLKEAYRILLRSGFSLEAALSRMTDLDDPLVSELIRFVRGSARGFCRQDPSESARHQHG
jgi:UDP-N-acetylglucosamine acyltransferase